MSSSDASSRPVLSPHPYPADPSSSLSPPSDFDWLAEKAETDKLTDLQLAHIGSEIESSRAAMFGPSRPDMNTSLPAEQPALRKPSMSSLSSAPLNQFASAELGHVPQFPAARLPSNPSYGSMPTATAPSNYPTLPTFHSGYAHLQQPPTDCQTRVSKPLAPPELSAVSHYSASMGIHKSPGPKPADQTEFPSDNVDPSSGRLSLDKSLELAPMGASSSPVGAVSPPGSPAQFGSFGQAGHSTAGAGGPKSIYPSLMNLTASFGRSGQEKTAGDSTETADSLVPSVHGMNLVSRRASVASLRSASSPSVPEEWVNEIEETGTTREERDSDSEGGNEGGESLPHHKRFRLSPGLTRRSTPSLAASSIQSFAHNLATTRTSWIRPATSSASFTPLSSASTRPTVRLSSPDPPPGSRPPIPSTPRLPSSSPEKRALCLSWAMTTTTIYITGPTALKSATSFHFPLLSTLLFSTTLESFYLCFLSQLLLFDSFNHFMAALPVVRFI
ncbi:hypothetical protein PtB15_16B45 [Puccinia triticina]|nr:hypothetical protein PtB15_16B45 [Puccinia triticina]